jgi:hypothetical protein
MRRSCKNGVGHEKGSNGINYVLWFMCVLMLFAWFYATVVVVRYNQLDMERESPAKAGQYALEPR